MGRRGSEDLTLDLRTLDLGPGEAQSLTLEIPVAPVTLGGQRYDASPVSPTATLEVSQSASGWHLRLQIAATFTGPCWRCLEPAVLDLAADVRDFQAFGRGSSTDEYDEDLDCEYLDGDQLDIGAMTRDALIDLFPATILCRDECAGLCPQCGANRNDEPCTCGSGEADPRWSGLAEIAERLRRSSE
jgi:uncharacterized protein